MDPRRRVEAKRRRIAIADEVPDAGVFRHQAQARRGIAGVERQPGRAGQRHREDRDHAIERALEIDAARRAGLQPLAHENGGERLRALIEFAVGKRGVIGTQRDPLGELGGGVGPKRTQCVNGRRCGGNCLRGNDRLGHGRTNMVGQSPAETVLYKIFKKKRVFIPRPVSGSQVTACGPTARIGGRYALPVKKVWNS